MCTHWQECRFSPAFQKHDQHQKLLYALAVAFWDMVMCSRETLTLYTSSACCADQSSQGCKAAHDAPSTLRQDRQVRGRRNNTVPKIGSLTKCTGDVGQWTTGVKERNSNPVSNTIPLARYRTQRWGCIIPLLTQWLGLSKQPLESKIPALLFKSTANDIPTGLVVCVQPLHLFGSEHQRVQHLCLNGDQCQ